MQNIMLSDPGDLLKAEQVLIPPHTANLQLMPSSWGVWCWSKAEIKSPKGFRRRRDTACREKKKKEKKNEDEEETKLNSRLNAPAVMRKHDFFFYVQLLPGRKIVHGICDTNRGKILGQLLDQDPQ